MTPTERSALCRSLFTAAVAAVEPYAAVAAHLRLEGEVLVAGPHRLSLGGRVVLVGAGKASAPMARAVEDLLGDRISGGVVVVKYNHGEPLRRVQLLEAAHPVPDAAGVAGAAAIEAAVSGLQPTDVVIVCLSGGASALLPAPRAPLTLADKQAVTRALLASGCAIQEVNTVRKRLSRLKGGGLLRAAAPARVLTLAISDVIGDDPGTIGSGPTVPDQGTSAQALAILRRCHGVPEVALELLAADALSVPTVDAACYHLVASNRLALRAAAEAAARVGLVPVIDDTVLDGEAVISARAFVQRARSLAPGSALIAGGETTVTLGADPGHGGRNQEFALACACALRPGDESITVLSGGTDGSDGPTDAAGGTADLGTRGRALAAGLDPDLHLARHDAYPLLAASLDLICTGPTRTNVMDVAIAIRS